MHRGARGEALTINVGRCPNCGNFLIGEEVNSHTCKALKGIQDLLIHHYYELSARDDEGHKVLIAKGLDGFLYRLIICKHKPPHSTKRNFTEYGPNGNLTGPLGVG